MPISKFVPVLALFSVGVTAPALAEFKTGSFMTKDGAEITPTLQTGVSSNSNFFSTPNDEESRLIWTIAPKIAAQIDNGPDSYKLNLGTKTSFHNKDTTDNFTQVNVGIGTHQEFTSQHRLDVTGIADWLYEPRGSGLSEGLGDAAAELIKYQQQNISTRYEYGALSSKAQVALTAGYSSKEYQNFRTISQFRDFDKSLVGITGYYNTQAATRTFVELTKEDYRYDVIDSDGISRNSDDTKVLLGVEWEATAVTSGSVKLGYQNKTFDSNLREDFSGLSWEAAVNWQPLSYSTVQLMTSRAAKDPLVEGDYIRESVYGITWNHAWSDFLSSQAGVNYIDEQYTGNVGREDKTKTARLGLNYIATNFGMISTYIDFVDKNSTQPTIEFDHVVVGINFTFALKANDDV
ncbi:outer membrane beta-barrel protein [Pseudoalteromonas sp. SWXJZ94C]|uniref:outer membrane beta-barrel protein n=1 Tax=Pseudoalteromonas sp. SWXJZ94C TaxID=2792065 RepID=UPI0018CF6D73|nr:outer membrane beta-barrel protein [Pseudoalteromonas sp. SWXJZ94C]MBH0055731.1 outer membrane beta-barrel protein [Pseudoalteromonas sp. SWXJZ94C]